ncbi:MAG: outer membrane beta-barrel protein [Acidobacteriota bacterium]
MALPSRSAVAFLGLLALGAIPCRAAGPWTIRVEGGTTDYSSETFSSYQSDTSRLRLDGGQGFGVAAEYRPSLRIGVELSLSRIDLDADWRQTQLRLVSTNPTVLREVTVASDSGTLSLRPLAVAFLFHLSPDRLDFYLGPQVSWVDYQIDVNGPPDRDAEFSYGGKVGLELALGESPWSVGASYRYLEVQHEGMERDQYTGIQLNLISAALSYRIGGR